MTQDILFRYIDNVLSGRPDYDGLDPRLDRKRVHRKLREHDIYRVDWNRKGGESLKIRQLKALKETLYQLV